MGTTKTVYYIPYDSTHDGGHLEYTETYFKDGDKCYNDPPLVAFPTREAAQFAVNRLNIHFPYGEWEVRTINIYDGVEPNWEDGPEEIVDRTMGEKP